SEAAQARHSGNSTHSPSRAVHDGFHEGYSSRGWRFPMAPSFTWQGVSPESQGMAADRLQALQDALARRRTHTLLVVRNDRIVWEWYAPEWGPHRPHSTASLAKALVGGMSLVAALDEGRMGVDDPAWKY